MCGGGRGGAYHVAPASSKCSPQASRKLWFAGTQGCNSEMGTQARWVQGQLALHTAPGLGAVTPQTGEVMFCLGFLSGLASLPSPLTGVGGQVSPLPLFPTAKGKINSISKLPVPLCHVWAKAAG